MVQTFHCVESYISASLISLNFDSGYVVCAILVKSLEKKEKKHVCYFNFLTIKS